jgi:dinuclear metal center YbgI/SA1388 family protein
MLTVKDIQAAIQNFAPFQYQESYDNSGLLVGNPEMEVNAAILCLDITEAVINEAIATKSNLIIAHHPILFSGIKNLNGRTYIERVIIKAIKHDIALLAVHTNLDNIKQGVNKKIAEKLGLQNIQVLKPMSDTLRMLYVYVPSTHIEEVKKSLFVAGAGQIGAYDSCSFTSVGQGSFKPSMDAQPFIGEKNELFEGAEIKLEVTFPKHLSGAVTKALHAAHPYEEIAFGILPLQNVMQDIGAGCMGELSAELSETDFLHRIKKNMKVSVIKHSQLCDRLVRKVAICGGSGSFLLADAIAQGADFFITADYKYHQFFDAENKIVIADIGHYESEQFTPEIFYELLSKKFPTFALQITTVNTNPVYYFK